MAKQFAFLHALKTKLAKVASETKHKELDKLLGSMNRRYAILTDPEIVHTRDALMHLSAAHRLAQWNYELTEDDLEDWGLGDLLDDWGVREPVQEMDDLGVVDVTEADQIAAVIAEDVGDLTEEIMAYLIGIEEQVNNLVRNPQDVHVNPEALVSNIVHNMEAAKESLVVALTALYTSSWAPVEQIEERKEYAA